uniref:Uncharacterized protein n=1 Tax=Myoviridae sp. ctWXg38 TaxID=2825119 RepID=A0A8S5PKQ3_9CAUD|nr:MAG TPA: hypothetical protein [Myoviridae sp. ctWXg38]
MPCPHKNRFALNCQHLKRCRRVQQHLSFAQSLLHGLLCGIFA